LINTYFIPDCHSTLWHHNVGANPPICASSIVTLKQPSQAAHWAGFGDRSSYLRRCSAISFCIPADGSAVSRRSRAYESVKDFNASLLAKEKTAHVHSAMLHRAIGGGQQHSVIFIREAAPPTPVERKRRRLIKANLSWKSHRCLFRQNGRPTRCHDLHNVQRNARAPASTASKIFPGSAASPIVCTVFPLLS